MATTTSTTAPTAASSRMAAVNEMTRLLRLLFEVEREFLRTVTTLVYRVGEPELKYLVCQHAWESAGHARFIRERGRELSGFGTGEDVRASIRRVFVEAVGHAQSDPLVITAGFYTVLKPALLGLPLHGMINAHASLLPLYRGAAPIQWAIRDGRAETGVTIMRIAEALDAGDVLLTKATPIDPKENAGLLRERLAAMSGEALVEACELIEKGKAKYAPQHHGKATYARKVEKEHGVIDWKLPAVEIDRLVRAMTPKPGAQTRLGNKRFIVIEGSVEQDLYGMGIPGALQSSGEEGIRVCTGRDLYRITRIKPDNGRNMTAGEFVRGHHIAPDARFG